MAFNQKNAKVSNYLPPIYGIETHCKLLPYVNLNNESKKKLGLMTFDDEPKYIFEKEDKDSGVKFEVALIELYFKINDENLIENETLSQYNDKVYTLRFYLENRERPAGKNTGKLQFINKKGESAWGMTKDDEFKYMSDKEGIRIAYVGEVDFMDAIKSITSMRTGIETFNLKKIFSGDFSEINTTIKDVLSYLQEKNKKNNFSVLFYIGEKTKEKDGVEYKYLIQKLYQKEFNPTKIRKSIEKSKENGYDLKGIYEKDGVITNYINIFEEKIEKSKQENSGENDDDLPF